MKFLLHGKTNSYINNLSKGVKVMAKRNKEQMKKATKNEKQRNMESKPGYEDKKLGGPDRPAE